MIKILFVCHGNICRSPMAEFVFKEIIKGKNLDINFVVSSSATSTEEIWNGVGNPVYPPAVRELKKHGIDPSGKRAIQLTREDYEKYDILIAMDEKNIRNSLRILSGDPDGKLHKLMDFTPRGGDVADPWYTGDFQATWDDVSEGCKELLAFILRK